MFFFFSSFREHPIHMLVWIRFQPSYIWFLSLCTSFCGFYMTGSLLYRSKNSIITSLFHFTMRNSKTSQMKITQNLLTSSLEWRLSCIESFHPSTHKLWEFLLKFAGKAEPPLVSSVLLKLVQI